MKSLQWLDYTFPSGMQSLILREDNQEFGALLVRVNRHDAGWMVDYPSHGRKILTQQEAKKVAIRRAISKYSVLISQLNRALGEIE